MDRAYLESPGWSGIRIRREHLEQMLRDAIRELHAAGGRCISSTRHAAVAVMCSRRSPRLREIPASAILRDYKPRMSLSPNGSAASFGLDKVKIVQADAFDRASYTRSNRVRRSASFPACSNFSRRTSEREPVSRDSPRPSSLGQSSSTPVNRGIRSFASSPAFCAIAKANRG